MDWWKEVPVSEGLLAGGVILLFVILVMIYSKKKRLIGKLLYGGISGVAVLYPVQLALSAAGYEISWNLFTIAVSAVLGLPGVALLAAAVLL